MDRLFHISEQPDIRMFVPRPSPQQYETLKGDVVFAITERLVHNYLFPRDCPRVCYYAGPATKADDSAAFFANSDARYIMTVESGWYSRIAKTTLYCYEFLPDRFTLLDECAGYYAAHEVVEPIATTVITDVVSEILRRGVELRFTGNLVNLANAVAASTLNFSLIRMRNAKL